VLKNVTITADEKVLKWARHEAVDKGISVSKFVGQVLEEQMCKKDAHALAVERWKKLKPIPGFDASKRLSREEIHERRR
jgi:hypothetical protein